MKKILAIILSICFVLCLTACNKDKTASDVTKDNSQTTSTQTQTNTSDESSDHSESNTLNNSNASNDLSNSNGADGSSNNTSIDTNNSNGTNSSSNSNNTNGSNNSNPPPHTHSYSGATCTSPEKCSCGATNGSALGHKWQDATCKAPKTCSVCKKAEGNKAEHIVEGTTCKWCKQVVEVNPSNFNANVPYSCISKRYDGEVFYYPNDFDCYVFNLLIFGGESSSEAVHDSAQCPYGKDGHRHVHHNGKYYDNIAQSSGFFGKTTYTITDSEIIASVPVSGDNISGKATIHFELLSNNTLKVSSVSGAVIPEIAGISVGTIFYPNPNYEISYN